MTLLLFRRLKTGALILVAAVALPTLYQVGRNFASVDPFARYAGGAYADPFGSNIGSFMERARVEMFEGSDLTVAFTAERLDIRRDRQYMNVSLITDGAVFDKGSKQAAFQAGIGVYDATRDRVQVAGGASVVTDMYSLSTDRMDIETGSKEIRIESQVSGRFREGAISAGNLLINYGAGTGRAAGVTWRGPVEVQQIGSRRDVQIRSESMEIESNPERQIFHNAEGSDDDSVFRARKIIWEKDTDIITMEGNCEYYGRDSIMTAPKIVINRKERKAVATGDVRLLVKPEKDRGLPRPMLQPAQPVLPAGFQQPQTRDRSLQREIDEELRSGRNFRNYPIVITCQRIEYTYTDGSRMAVLTGSPRARQEMRAGSWREMTSPRAVYDAENETLTLLSGEGGRDVRMKNSTGDEMVAEKIEISSADGNDRLRAWRMNALYKVDDDDVGDRPPPPPGGG